MLQETCFLPITAVREIKLLSDLRHENVILMKEIVTLDANGEAGLKKKYTEIVAKIEESRDLQAASKELQSMIEPHMQAGEGDKALAKRAMLEAQVPCIPGYQGDDQSDIR